MNTRSFFDVSCSHQKAIFLGCFKTKKRKIMKSLFASVLPPFLSNSYLVWYLAILFQFRTILNYLFFHYKKKQQCEARELKKGKYFQVPWELAHPESKDLRHYASFFPKSFQERCHTLQEHSLLVRPQYIEVNDILK